MLADHMADHMVAAGWRQRDGGGGRQLVGSEAARTLPTTTRTNTQGWWWWCVCELVSSLAVALLTTLTPANSQPLPHIHPPEYARHTPATTAASHFMPSWPPQGSVKQGLGMLADHMADHMVAAARRQGGGSAADSWSAPRRRGHCPPPHAPTHRGGGGVCVWWSQPLWLSSPHSLPPTPNHSLTFTRPNTHATRQPPPPHPISCRHGHHRAVSNKGWACWPTTWRTTGWRQAWRQGGGSVAADSWSAPRRRGHCPPPPHTNTQGWWCVCVVVSASVALLTTLTPANSQPLPHIHPPEYARHTPATTAASHFMPSWPPQGSVKQGLGMLADHMADHMVAAGWRQRLAAADSWSAPRRRGHCPPPHTPTHRGGGVCVWWSQPLWLSSPHSLPPTPNHSLTFTRPNTHATRQPPPPHPISCRHGHHRAVSNKGWACWPTTWPTTWWRQAVAAGWRQRGGRQLVGSEAARTLPTTTRTNTQGWWCVCVVVSASVALLTTLTPANSQPLPHIHPPEYARHTPATTAASHFMPSWPSQGTVKQGLGMLADHMADHMVAAGWRQRGGRQLVGSEAARTLPTTTHTNTQGWWCVCVWWSQPLWLSSPHSLPPTPNHSLTFTRPNTHATRQPPPPHPISCRHGHHRAVSNKGWACWPTTWPTTWWRQRGGRVAAARRQTAGRLRGGADTAHHHTHQHTGVVVVCVWWSQPLWLSSPHSLPPTPNHSLTFTRPNTHATRQPPPPHPISCRHGHHRAVSNKGWACWPTTWPTTWWRQAAAGWRQRGGRQLVGSEAARTLPTTTHTNTQGWWCVCVVVSASVALLTTLTPANSQPLPHIHPPEYARHTPATTAASHFMPSWPPQGSVKQGLGMLADHMADHMVAAGWRQRGGRQLVGSEAARTLPTTTHTNTQGWWCVCVWWSQPLWLSSPHSLPPTPNHSLTFTRPNTHATRQPPPPHPISCRHGHHRAVSNKGWACWPTTWPTTWWRQVAAGWRQRGGRQLVGSEAARTLPTTTTHQHTGVVVCVCVCGLSLCGSPHHTHSRQLPTTPSHSPARIRTPHASHHRRIPFHAVMATTGQCQTRAGHAGRPHGRPHGGGSAAAGWRQRGGRQLVGSEAARTLPTTTTHQHTGVVVVCVWWSQPLWLSSPHSLPPTPNHSLTFTRPNTHATRQPPPPHPISCRHGHHRAVSNKGWACWPTTWPTTWWRQGR